MMQNDTFVFTGVIIKVNNVFSSICIDIDVASEGLTREEAKSNLVEAVSLYIESAIENNLPVFRPVPKNENPLLKNPDQVVEVFDIKISLDIKVHV